MWSLSTRFATLAMLSFQLLVLAVGARPVPDACCCVSKGKACKCKGHAKTKVEGPCLSSGCGTDAELELFVMEWVTLPEPRTVEVTRPLPMPSWPAPNSWERQLEPPESPPPNRV